MMFMALNGLGQCTDDTGDSIPCAPITDPGTGATLSFFPTATTGESVGSDTPLSVLGYPTTSSASVPTGSPATGFNWGILTSIIPSLAQTAGATTASVLNAQTNAQTASSIAAGQIAASQASQASSSTFMMLGLAAAAVVVVVMIAKGKG